MLMVAAGFALLGVGGDALVRGGVGLATRLGLSRLFIGLVLVGFGTSAPELAASLNAALQGAPQIAAGNVIGSNIANALLILGVAGVIAPVDCDPAAFRRDAPVLAIATLAGVAGVFMGGFGRIVGLAFAAGLALYIVAAFRAEKRAAASDVIEREADLIDTKGDGLAASFARLVVGVAMVSGGAVVMVAGATRIALGLGVPEATIGLTIVAVGTSLPELAAAVAAARKGETDLAYGNVIGSNIFNLLGILGITAAVAPIDLSSGFMRADAVMMALATLVVFVFARTGERLSRLEGVVLFVAYGGYLAFLAIRSALAAA